MRHRKAHTSMRSGLIAALIAVLAGPVAGQQVGTTTSPPSRGPAPELSLKSCEVEGVEGSLQCATLTVYEDRTAQAGRTIPLNVVVLPATGEGRAPDPLFFLVGGPGQAATREARGVARDLAGVRERRDIVLVDVRGTGESNPLRCTPESPQTKLGFLSWSLPDSLVVECVSEFRGDPVLYTTPFIVDDLDDVRAALGYERINLYGTSYGTRAALVYARRHPDRVRSLVLNSVAPLGHPISLLPARHGQAALEGRFAACAADDECRARFPDPGGDLHAVLERLSTAPARATFVDPASGDTTEVQITREIFAGGVQFALYAPPLAERLPEAIHRAAAGDFGPFLEVATPMAMMLPRSISLGLFFSVTCTEDASVVEAMDAAALAQATEGTFLGRTAVEAHARVCATWPRGNLAADYHEPVFSTAPVLLISGEWDPITPPSLAEVAMHHLPNSYHIVVPGAGHSPRSECVTARIDEFLNASSVEGLEMTCLR